jgi:dTDP-4-dehydrorhamnose reductase
MTGATGFIGRRLVPGLEGAWRVVAGGRDPGPGGVALDLADQDSIKRAFDAVRPAAVVHAGGMADPDQCEDDPPRAKAVNHLAVRELAFLCGRAGTRLVFFSTDLVFDGERGWYTEDDQPNPLGVYARTKLDAEAAALTRAPGAAVLRVSSCYGKFLGGRPGFVDHMTKSLAAGEPVMAFVDQWRSSTAADQLPEVVARILKDPDLEGVFHWGGAERATRHEAARIFARVRGFDEGLVREARAADKRFKSPRPRDSSMDSSRLAAALGLAPLTYEAGFRALPRS